MTQKKINFNNPYLTGYEIKNIKNVLNKKIFSNEGQFSKKCENYITNKINSVDTFLTPSCTHALEISAILLDLKVNDEIIIPSYTFVSSANAFVLRGAKPVFIDIRQDTLNIDEEKIEEAITKKTKAIVIVHYAGVACDMDKILSIVKKHKLVLIEDAAHAFDCKYKNKYLGSFGDISCFSFHDTKNIISGVGGAIAINKKKYKAKLEIIRQKGTNRSKFLENKSSKYSWQDVGSSYVPGEIMAAFLWSQLKNSRKILNSRMKLWKNYHNYAIEIEKKGLVNRPHIPFQCSHNGHIYYLILKNKVQRNKTINYLKNKNIQLTSHYEPLHLSPAGIRYGTSYGKLNMTKKLSDCILRLPLWIGLKKTDQKRIIRHIFNYLEK